jgi:hypothetical protein
VADLHPVWYTNAILAMADILAVLCALVFTLEAVTWGLERILILLRVKAAFVSWVCERIRTAWWGVRPKPEGR